MPGYITSMFEKDQTVYTNLRSSSHLNYTIPRPKIEQFKESISYSGPSLEQFKESISYSGPSIWNRIPESIRCMNTIDSFTTQLIRWLKSVK